MSISWLDEVKKRLAEELSQSNGIQLERLQAQGIIDVRGEVTGKLRRWDAFLAITEIKLTPDRRRICSFRCLKPVFGLPGGATIDIRRESMVDYLKAGEKVVTASWDQRLSIWKEGAEVQLTGAGFVRTDSSDDHGDSVGELPEFH